MEPAQIFHLIGGLAWGSLAIATMCGAEHPRWFLVLVFTSVSISAFARMG